jgi:protein-disulfide isomerase
LLILSQFVWVPRVMGREGHSGDLLGGPSTAGVMSAYKPGAWLDQPASGLTLGPANAPIRIEEFTDFQCPFCGRAHRVMLEVVKEFSGKVHLVHRDFPLDDHCNPAIPERFHENACNASFHARCAADQDSYWPFETMLFEHQKQLDDRTMLSIATKLGLNAGKLKVCVQAPGTREAVLRDIQEGIARGVQGTPTCFVNGEALVGAHPIEFWEQKIQSLLDAVESPAASASASSSAAPEGSAPSAPPPPASGSATPATHE